MFFIKASTKKNKGSTLIELIISLSLVVILMFVIVSTFIAFSKVYKEVSQYSKSNISTKETLYFIEKETEEYGSKAVISDNVLYIYKYGYLKSKVVKGENTLYYYYQDGTKGYKQPLLYDVTLFEVKEKENLLYVKLKIKEGKEFERYFVK